MTATADRVDGAKFIPTWELHDTLRKARQTTGMDQKTFAEKIGVTAGSYAGWEAGRSKPRDPIALAKRVEMLTRIPATWILGIHDETPRPGGPNGGSEGEVRPERLELPTF
ncbi:helix-turn-helix domain-containing protein, partial [Nocardia puris]|uniref:helix-turn-helix domain-containing protein n=1 Tax=Nocardia puris TaxID=208602 RepID=UPI0011BD6436